VLISSTVHQPSGPPVDAATVAADIQRQTDRREMQCSVMALAVKLGLIVLGCVSIVRLSVAYQERLERHGEIDAVVTVETVKLQTLQQRFDRLFSIGGEKRLMSEQDQWIAPNRMRIIWR
tara:strand:+ start:316 stop:675 length:360 start_codon:yes stop_codon:yes gene_type:complete